MEVVADAADGLEAVDLAARLQPDVITMDVVMPRLDGLAATAALMAQSPTRVIIVANASAARETHLSFKAMEVGALELIPKVAPHLPFEQWSQRLVQAIRLMAEVPVVKRRRRKNPITGSVALKVPQRIAAIGIASSCGGPVALQRLLALLPENFKIPILVAQHLAPGFAKGFVRWLNDSVPIKVVEGHEGLLLTRGHVYIADGGSSMVLQPDLTLGQTFADENISPSANALLRSMAEVLGTRACGVVLTGMGNDGAEGLMAIREAGGVTMAQDEESSVVFGMPKAAFEMGATTHLFDLNNIAHNLTLLTGAGHRVGEREQCGEQTGSPAALRRGLPGN